MVICPFLKTIHGVYALQQRASKLQIRRHYNETCLLCEKKRARKGNSEQILTVSVWQDTNELNTVLKQFIS